MRSAQYPLVLFILVAAGELIAQFLDITWLHHLCKPLIMVMLGIYYFMSLASPARSNVVIAAITFSFAGDSFLMYDHLNEVYFMLGLGSFLLAHVLYAITYSQHRHDPEYEPTNNVQLARMAFPIILAGTGLIVVLYPRLGELRIPVIIYAGVLMLMVLMALYRLGKTNADSFWKVFVGAMLFMISDSILAINKFLEPVSGAGIWIMITYIVAQYLIIEGLIRHARVTSRA